MGTFGLDDWQAVADEREWPVLLVGNGASRAVSAKFSYDSLFDVAPLPPDDRAIFAALSTHNFEEVLDYMRIARVMCGQLGHDVADVEKRFSSIRDALIATIGEHHVQHSEVAGDKLRAIRQALRTHESVFSTNYDLLFYWAIMSDGVPAGDGFGDLFWNPSMTFDALDTLAYGGKTLVYWMHGGLHLYRDENGQTRKRTGVGGGLLDTFASDERAPLFVSEGTAEEKRRAIRRSDYLEHAYNAFSRASGSTVVFGQALAESDEHLVQALRRTPGRHIAYGVHARTQKDANLQRAYIENLLPEAAIRFFDSKTHPLGMPELLIP